LSGLVLAVGSGCATTNYQFGRFHQGQPDGIALQPVVIERGEPNKTLDRIGWVVGLPARILTLNKKVNNHDISPETVETLQDYLEQNDITDVYVAINQYDPKGQWKRLRENNRIAPAWRYSAGTLTWLGYTLFPGRVFGGDRYDPFSNTLNLNSDVPALVLSEAAYAKDIHSQKHPGAYATLVNDLPLLTLWRQGKAASDVLSYAQLQEDWDLEKEAYHVLYPQLASGAVGTAGPFVPVYGPFLGLGGALVGHATGRTVAAVRESQLRNEPSRSLITTAPRDTRDNIDDRTPPELAGRNSSPRLNRVIPASYEYEDESNRNPAR